MNNITSTTTTTSSSSTTITSTSIEMDQHNIPTNSSPIYYTREQLIAPPYTLIADILSIPVHIIKSISNINVEGGLSCIITRHTINYFETNNNTASSIPIPSTLPTSFIIKTNRPNTSDNNENLTKNVGLTREALFYTVLSKKILRTLHEATSSTTTTTITNNQDNNNIISIPYCYYGYADTQTGNKLMVLEDASNINISCPTPTSINNTSSSALTNLPPINSGICFGPGSPLNWNHKPEIFENAYQYYGNCSDVTSSAFFMAANLHNSYFGDKTLLTYPWLRGVNAYINPNLGKEEFLNTQAYAMNNWKSYIENNTVWKQNLENYTKYYQENSHHSKFLQFQNKCSLQHTNTIKINDVEWPEYLLEIITLSLSQISWETYQLSLTTNKFRQYYTLVHGDYHPGNILIYSQNMKNKYAKIMVLDYENIGIGSGPQDCGQFIISHMDPKDRQTTLLPTEKDFFYTHYYQHLSTNIQQLFTFEECYQEYIYGGIERWVWLLCLLGSLCPSSYIQYWVNQLSTFCEDHSESLNFKQLSQPRL